MITSYGKPYEAQFRSYLDKAEQTAFLETAPGGWDYFVADPEKIGIESGVVGHTIVSADQIEMELVLGEDIPKEARQIIASICADSAGLYDRYAIPRTGDQHLQDADPNTKRITLTHIARNLEAHKRGIQIMDQKRKFSEIHPLTRDSMRSSLGWVALNRDLNATGREILDQLAGYDLFIPNLNSDLRLGGILRTAKGPRPVGIVAATEKSEKHHCAGCSGQILLNTQRFTLSLDKPDSGYDHHHYHPVCLINTELPKLDLASARMEPNPHAISTNKFRKK